MYCRRCGAPLHQGLVICPECGARQRRRFSAVRCAACGGRVALGLSVCPHCGRNVRPAGPRIGLWLAGLILLALAALWGLGKLPVNDLIAELQSARERVAGVIEVLGPAAADLSGDASKPAREIALAPESEGEAVVVTGSGPLAADNDGTPTVEAISAVVTASVTADVAAATPLASAPDAETPTPTATATDAPTATQTLQPTETPTLQPTETPTLAPPTATAIPPTPTVAPARGGTTYTVKSGDTLSSIASKFGITWQSLAEANNLTSRSVLRVGQVLQIPGQGGPAPAPPTATAQPRPTAAPAPTSAPPPPAPDLPAPVLISPGDQTPFSGPNSFELVWQPVPGFPAGAVYRVMIVYTDTAGQPQQRWWDTTATGARVPYDLYQQAAQPARKYTWYVTVVQLTTDGKGGEKVTPLSPPSSSRVFYWS